MDKTGLRDALPQPKLSDTRTEQFWNDFDSNLSAAMAAQQQPVTSPATKRDLNVGLGDVARGVGAGALELVGGIGELARQASQFGKENAGKQGGDYLEQARANMASKLSPVLDKVAGVGDLAKSGAESLTEGMSGDAKEAIGRSLIDETPEGRLTVGDGAGDIDVWAMKFAQGIGSMVPTLGAGAATAIGRAVTVSMIKRGVSQKLAEQVAAKTVHLSTGAAMATGVTGSVGSAGVNTRESVLGMSFDELSQSDTFRQAFTRIDQDQQTQHLSDEEKLSLAREETANVASRATMSDAKVWGAAAMGSVMGDAMLFKMLAGKAATGGVLKGAAKGAVGEGIGETLEEGVQQYTINESLNEVAAADIDPMKGVVSSALEGGLIGMGTGGALGGAGGLRGSKSQPESEGGAQVDPATVEGVAPVEPGDPVQANPAAAQADPDLAPAADTIADPVVAPSGEQSPLGPSASQFPGVFERDQRGILRVKGDVDALAAWAEQANMPYITDGDGIAIPAKYAKQAEKAIKRYKAADAKPLAEPALADDMPEFSKVDPIEEVPAYQRQGDTVDRATEPQAVTGTLDLGSEIGGMFAGEHNPLGSDKFDPVREVPAFQRQGFVRGSHDFKGTPIVPLEGELLTPGSELMPLSSSVEVGAPRTTATASGPGAGELLGGGAALPDLRQPPPPQQIEQSDTIFAGGEPGADPRNSAYTPPRLSRDQVDRTLGEESTRDPRSPVSQSIARAGSETDSVFGPLQTLRITRKGKPFATEKEAAMASRKGKEMPVPLNGGGFGVAEIAEVEQVQAANNSNAINGPQGNNQPQAEVSNEPVTPVPAISSEGQGDHPGAGEPAAAGAGPAIARLTDRAGSGDPADNTPAPPVPDGQQQDDQTLTAPATDAGAAVSEVVQPDPVAPEPAAAPVSNVRMSQQQEGLSVDEASKVVDDFLKDYNGNIPVEPFIREKANEIYGPAIDEQGLGDKTKGAYHPGKSIVTVVSRNARDGVSSDRGSNRERSFSEDQGRVGGREVGRSGAKADLITTLRHELLGHYGTDTFTPENKQRLLQKLIEAKNEKWIAPVWKQIAGDSVYGKKSDLHQAEEVFAHIAEKELPPRTIQAWNDIKTEFARLLRKAGLVKGPIKEHELDSLIKAVGKGIRNGERTKQNIRGDQEVIGKQADEPAKDDKPERIISFSKQAMAQGEKPAKHLTSKEAELVTKEWFKQYRGASGIDVQIHATQAELERALGLAAKDGLIRRAAFDDDSGTLHVAADTIANPKRMREILRHEVLAHYGLANVLGDGEYTKLISRIIKSKSAPSMKAVWEWVDTHYAGEDVGVQAEEVIAHLAELEQSAWRRGWDQVVAWVTKALRTVGFVPGGITAAETRVLIEGLGKKMKHGGPDNGGPDGGHKFSQESEQPTRMSQEIGAGADKGSLRDVIKSIRGSGVTILATERGGVINIAKIAVNESERGSGKGTSAMREIMRYADRTSQMIALSPSADFGGNKSRLETFYKGLGFIENKGKNKDFSISESMYRPANEKPSVRFSQANTAADKAMEKLNLGAKPDIIDKTKANLDKLRKVERGVVESWVDRFIKKANTEVLDALAPIKYAEDAAGITDAADSGYVAARMATGAASTMQATMLYGLPEWKDGVIQRKAGTGEKDALLGIFSDLGADLHNWLGWMAGHRAELLMAQGRENLLDANDIAALKGQGKGKEAKFLDAKARWNRLNAATLDLAQEAGLFTKEARAEFENEWYIPFFRESEDGDVIAPFKPKGIANQNAGIKKLKGGEANTNDLLENIFTSTSKLIDASMKNMAAQKTVWNLADTGLIEVIPKPNKMDYQALANGKDRIMLKLEGEEYMLRVEDPDLYRAMTFFDRKPFGKMTMMASSAKRILTAGVTASPEFMLRNFLRDSLSSWAISKDGFKPVIDSIKGVKKTLAMDGSTIDVMFSGASFLGGYVNGNDPGAMADTVRKSLRRKGMTPEQIARYEKSIIRNAAHAKGVVADAWEKYSRYGEALENANREAVYAAAIKAGKSHAQAAFESKDLMDFSMLGAARAIQGASLVLPFFNARLQGLGKLSRELRDNPREIAKRAGMITAMSLGLLAANWDDERYEELPDWDKDANWHFFVGDQHFRIPKPFEIGVMFGTIPERMVRAMGDKDTGAQFGKAVARAIGDTFALNPTPQIVKPLVEAAFNYDTFRGGPIDSPQDLAVKAEARYNEQTSLLMRELGELSGFSPKQLEHLVIGYTGTIGGYVMATADGLIRASRPGESASWRADEIPLVKAVYRGTGPAKSTQHMEEFYRMLSEVNQLKRTVDQYRSEGLDDKANELLEEQGGILKSRRSLSSTQQQVRVVRNKIELIQRDRTMNAEEKRKRIDELLARRNDLVYQAVNKNRENWE
ncbi:LPD38 domain-containing protein [Aeromonas veronii]|uniref:LPD38 domain-containing protein n=1 Tax=Aeromonas veronii TaxID=654 RepID=UPI003BA15A65